MMVNTIFRLKGRRSMERGQGRGGKEVLLGGKVFLWIKKNHEIE